MADLYDPDLALAAVALILEGQRPLFEGRIGARMVEALWFDSPEELADAGVDYFGPVARKRRRPLAGFSKSDVADTTNVVWLDLDPPSGSDVAGGAALVAQAGRWLLQREVSSKPDDGHEAGRAAQPGPPRDRERSSCSQADLVPRRAPAAALGVGRSRTFPRARTRGETAASVLNVGFPAKYGPIRDSLFGSTMRLCGLFPPVPPPAQVVL